MTRYPPWLNKGTIIIRNDDVDLPRWRRHGCWPQHVTIHKIWADKGQVDCIDMFDDSIVLMIADLLTYYREVRDGDELGEWCTAANDPNNKVFLMKASSK